jgi:uncharacterized protein DUF5996
MTGSGATGWPELEYGAWRDTLATVHRFAQVVGKVRLAGAPRRNHWWHVPFHLTGRGITTRPMGDPGGAEPIFAIDFDFLDHRLEVSTIDGRREGFPLPGLSVAGFTRELIRSLDAAGVSTRPARLHPFDLPDADRPFDQDDEHAGYDPAAVTRYWQTLSRVNLLLERYAADWSGKTSPVHHFWHTFDIAVTRFSDRHVDPGADADSVTREAYSREVISAGFWFGDDEFREAAFYSYTAPEPAGLPDEPLRPEAARWLERRGSHLAVLTYSDARRHPDPCAAVLDFYDSAFRAGARRAGWDLVPNASPGGVTDPHAP